MTLRESIERELMNLGIDDYEAGATRVMAVICEAYFESVRRVPFDFGTGAVVDQRAQRDKAARILSQHRYILSDGSEETEIYTCKCNDTLIFIDEATYHLHVANELRKARLFRGDLS